MRILFVGLGREPWAPADHTGGDVHVRLGHYAAHTEASAFVVAAHPRHRLAPVVPVGARGRAVAAVGRTRVGRWCALVGAALREGRALRADLVQAQEPFYTGLAAYVASRRLGCPLNVCVYGATPFDPHWVAAQPLHRLLAPLGRFVLRRADGVQADGVRTVRTLLDAGLDAARVRLKPMVPANLDAFFGAGRDAARREELLGPEGTCLVMAAGRLVRQKRFDLLLDALAQARVQVPGLRLVVVGEGPERARLHRCADRLGVAGAVRWLGAVAHADLPPLLAAADVFALASDYEGFPRVLMEAAAAGCALVATDVSGADDVIAEGVSGRLVPVGDAGALAGALVALASHAAARQAFGQAAQARMRHLAARFGNLDRQLDVWRAMLGASPGPATPAHP